MAVDFSIETMIDLELRNMSLTSRIANVTVDFWIHNSILSFDTKVGTLCSLITGFKARMKTLIHGLASLSGSHSVPTFVFFILKEPDSFMKTSLNLHADVVKTLSLLSQNIPNMSFSVEGDDGEPAYAVVKAGDDLANVDRVLDKVVVRWFTNHHGDDTATEYFGPYAPEDAASFLSLAFTGSEAS